MHESVTVNMAASPQRVWDLVSDVTRIGRYSPETFEAEWIEGATGPAVGARFRGHVRRNGIGPTYWTACTVEECEPGSVFTFGVGPPGRPLSTWGYHLEPTDGGTEVTETFRLADKGLLRLYWALLGWARGRTNRHNMRITLERIRAEVESGGASQEPVGEGPDRDPDRHT